MTQLVPKPEVVTTVRLSPDEHETVRALAEREGRSFNSQLRYVIRQLAGKQKEPA